MVRRRAPITRTRLGQLALATVFEPVRAIARTAGNTASSLRSAKASSSAPRLGAAVAFHLARAASAPSRAAATSAAAESANEIRKIQRVHQSEKRWADIGYHYIIDRVKQVAPIWKREVGPDGASWVE